MSLFFSVLLVFHALPLSQILLCTTIARIIAAARDLKLLEPSMKQPNIHILKEPMSLRQTHVRTLVGRSTQFEGAYSFANQS